MAALAWFLLGPYNSYRIDRLRQDLFSIRDQLFLDAADGVISFDSRAYLANRAILNGMIRYTHRISLVRFLASYILLSKADVQELQDGIQAELSASAAADRRLCAKYMRKAHLSVAYHLMTSPFMLVLIWPMVAMALGRLGSAVARKIVRWQSPRFETLDGVFYRDGIALAS